MCKVVLENPRENVDFIIYNHLFSIFNYRFTINQLTEDLKQYNLSLSKEDVQEKVSDFIRLGLVCQSYKDYTVCSR